MRAQPKPSLREPLHIPRWVLALKYLGFAGFGVVAYLIGVPRLDLTTPDGYRPIWAAVIVIAALASLIALLAHKPRVERWTVMVLIAFLLAYIYAIVNAALGGEPAYAAVASILPLVLLLPVGRFVAVLPRGRR